MKQKLITARRLVSTFILMAAFVVTQFAGVQFAHAAVVTAWTGAGDGTSFSDATNWSAGVPAGIDAATFDISNLSAQKTLNNNISGWTGAISVSGTSASYFGYIITGNLLTLSGAAITNTGTGPSSTAIPLVLSTGAILSADTTISGGVSFGGVGKTLDTQGHSLAFARTTLGCAPTLPVLVGSGSVSLSNVQFGNYDLMAASPSYTGAISVSSGYLTATNVGAFGGSSGVTVSGSGNLSLYSTADSTWNFPLVLGGTGSVSAQHDGYDSCGGGSDATVYTATLTGPVSLQSDFAYSGSDNFVVNGTYTPNGHTFAVKSGTSGTLTLPTGVVTAQAVTHTYSDNQPTQYVSLGIKETGILDGSRGYVNVSSGGILMGSGVAQDIYVSDGGIIAPGHSPGKLTATQTLYISGTYQAQLKDSAAGDYDQIQVSDPSRTTGNDVTIGTGGKLDTSLYTGYSINKGDQFMIIKNLQPASQKVSGTFSGLAEGTQFTVSGITFSISYIGGDGNDVVLTALTTGKAPTAPNTGIASLKLANPVVLAGLGIVAAGILYTLARRRFNK